MKFGKRYSKGTVFMAMLHGVVIGVAAVAVIGLLLMGQREDVRNARKRYRHSVLHQLKIQQHLWKSH